MDDPRIVYAAWLRQKAAQCRDLAETASSRAMAEQLRAIALEYDADAINIECQLPSVQPPVPAPMGMPTAKTPRAGR